MHAPVQEVEGSRLPVYTCVELRCWVPAMRSPRSASGRRRVESSGPAEHVKNTSCALGDGSFLSSRGVTRLGAERGRHFPVSGVASIPPAPRWPSNLFVAAASSIGEITVELRSSGPAPGPRRG